MLSPLRIYALLWLAVFAPPAAAQCGKPTAALALPPEGGGLPGFVFNKESLILSGSFAPQIQVYTRPDGSIQIWKKYRPSGDTTLVWEGMANGLPAELKSICGQDWYNQYFPTPTNGTSPSARAAAASTSAASTGQAAQGFLVVDLNGDGNPDAVSLNGSGAVVELKAGNGTTLSTTTFSTGFSPTPASEVIAADFNHDGKLDLAVSNYGDNPPAQGSIAILMGNGNGTFGAPKIVPAGLNPLSFAAADFNGDGKLDLAVANQASPNSGTITLLPGNGDGTFAAPLVLPTGEDSLGLPRSILAVDLNGDGAPDLAIANRGDRNISVLLATGGGRFAQPVIAATPCEPEYLAYGDLNHDGKTDLVAPCSKVRNDRPDFANAFVILLGNGNGTFQSAAAYATGNNPVSIGVEAVADGNTLLITADGISGDTWFTVVSPSGVVGAPPVTWIGGSPTSIVSGDLNGDGQPDLVITGAASDVTVLLSQGGTGFKAPVGYSLGQISPAPAAVAIGDLNGDGKPDVIVANTTQPDLAGSVSVLLGNGDGTLRAPTSIPVNETAQSVAVGDFNRDGKLDAVVAAYGTLPGGSTTDPGGVLVLIGKGDGTFQPPKTLTVSGLHPEAVVVADLNGDGKLDLAVAMVTAPGTAATLAIFLGQGDGSFAAARTFPLRAIGGTQSAVAIGDINGDGKLDLAVTSNFGQQVDILLGDGAGGFQEASTLTTESGPNALALTDLDGDGKLDLAIPHCCLESDATYFPGNGDGTFQAEQHLVSGSEPVGVAAAGGLAFANANGSMSALSFLGVPAVSAVSVVPAAGTGPSHTFTFTFAAAGGYQNLNVVDVLINNALDGRRACYVAFAPGSSSLFLVDDAGDAAGPYQGLVLPGGNTIANSQCSISGAGSSVSGSGNTLTLTLAITFSHVGNYILYLSAQDKSSASSGWQALGTWSVRDFFSPGGPGVSGMSPARGNSLTQTYTFTFVDNNGWQDISVANILINSAIDGRQACYVAFVPATSSLFLVDDAGDAGGPYSGMVLPGSGTVSNSQCSIAGVGSSVSGSGFSLTLTLALTFTQSFVGNQVFFLAARNSTQTSNWQPVGSVSVP